MDRNARCRYDVDIREMVWTSENRSDVLPDLREAYNTLVGIETQAVIVTVR